MTDFQFEPIDAVRLAVAGVAVLILPGALVLWRVRSLACWSERVVLSMAASYALLVPVCALVMAFGLSIGGATVVLAVTAAGAVALLTFLGPSARLWQAAPRPADLLPLAIAVGLGAVAWWLEPGIDGEELFELTIVRKMLTNPHITFSNVMHRPDAPYTYVLAPYPLLVALVSHLGGAAPYAAYAKLRTLYVAVSALAVYALTRRATGSRVAAHVAVAGLGVLVLIDPDPWFWPASLFPLVRRGSFAAGVLVPAAMLLVLWCARARRRAVPIALLAASVFAALFTHALTSVFILWWAGGLLLAALLSRRRIGRAVVPLATVLGAFVCFRAITASFAPHVAEYLNGNRAATLSRLGELFAARDWRESLTQSLDGFYFLATSAAVTVYAAFPFLLLPLAAAGRTRFAHRLLSASVPVLLLYTTTITLSLLQLATIDEIIFAAGYFALVGWVSWSAFLTTAATTAVAWLANRIGASLLWLIVPAALALGWFALAPACVAMMHAWVNHSALAPWTALVLWGVAAWSRRWWEPRSWPRTQPGIAAAAALCLMIPCVLQLKTFPGKIAGSDRSTLLTQLWTVRSYPSQWPAHYEARRGTPSAITDIPFERLQEMARVLPTGAVVMYDPRYSFSLPALLDVYIVNPGVRVSTDLLYDEECIDRTGPAPVHPLYNSVAGVSERERMCLAVLGVTHVLVNPPHRATVAAKLAELTGWKAIYDRDGFAVFARSAFTNGGRVESPRDRRGE